MLTVEFETYPQAAVLRLHGSAGVTEAKSLRDALGNLIAQGVPTVVLDLGDLHYVASVAASAIAAGLCHSDVHRERIRLAAPSPSVLDVLARSQVIRYVRVFPSVEAAMESDPFPRDPAASGRWQSEGASEIAPGKGARGLPTRIAVKCDPQEAVTPVSVRRSPGSALERLVARVLGQAKGPEPLPLPQPT